MRFALCLALVLTGCGEPADKDPNDTDSTDTDATGGGGGGGGSGGGGGTGSDNPVVDATCIDGAYSEVLPNASESLAAANAAFSANNSKPFFRAALDARYPTGRTLLDGGLQNQSFGDCVDLFVSSQQATSADGLLDAIGTVVHECGHFHDLNLGGFFQSAYQVHDDVLLTCSGGTINDVPARSVITGDAYNDLRPACPGNGTYGCDSYAQIYLTGQSGNQGFNMLHEETMQYVHSLATDYAFADRLGQGQSISARDGILTFLWYTERYLRYLRLNNTAAYNSLIDDSCWREVILTTWGRAWLFLDETETMNQLGIDDDDLMTLVMDEDLLGEIQRVRDAEGCD